MKCSLGVFVVLLFSVNFIDAADTKKGNNVRVKIKKQKTTINTKKQRAKPAHIKQDEDILTRAQVVHMPFITASDFTVQDPISKQNKFMVTAATGSTEVIGSLNVSGATSLVNVEATKLHVVDASTLTGNTTVGGSLGVTGTTTLANAAASNLSVNGNEVVGGTLNVTGMTTLSGVAAGSLNVSGTSTLTGNTVVGGTLGVTGAATVGNMTASNIGVTSNVMVGGSLGVVGATTLSDVTVNGVLTATDNLILSQNLEVDGTAFFDGTVIVHDGLLVGQKVLADLFATSTQTLLQLVLPDAANYIGLVNLTYLANIKQGNSVNHLEVATAKYLISHMDLAETATVLRIEDSYFNETGSIDVPAASGSEYARFLECEYDGQWTSGVNKRVINVRYLPPTASGVNDTNVTVLYEIRSGPGSLGRSLQIA